MVAMDDVSSEQETVLSPFSTKAQSGYGRKPLIHEVLSGKHKQRSKKLNKSQNAVHMPSSSMQSDGIYDPNPARCFQLRNPVFVTKVNIARKGTEL